jgi:hypothetical protein
VILPISSQPPKYVGLQARASDAWLQKLFSLMQSHLSILTFISWATAVLFKQSSLYLYLSWSAFPMFSFSIFDVLGLTFRALIHFGLIFLQGKR